MLPGNMVTVRAEAGVGKTAFVLSAVLNLIEQVRPWFVSLEMPATELVMRALCQLAMVDIDAAMLGHIDDAERARLGDAASRHADILSRLDIDDSGSMTTDEFLAKAEHRVKNGVGLIVVDYAQLMSADKKLYPNRVSELEAISASIRAVARKCNVPVLCVVHVNRLGEDHGTSQFEKDAHVRLHLAREVGAEIMTVEVLKNRNGRPGSVEVPTVMRHGTVGRLYPPAWSAMPVAKPLPAITVEAPMDWTEPVRNDEPF
jgi:replicative DNA helicase